MRVQRQHGVNVPTYGTPVYAAWYAAQQRKKQELALQAQQQTQHQKRYPGPSRGATLSIGEQLAEQQRQSLAAMRSAHRSSNGRSDHHRN